MTEETEGEYIAVCEVYAPGGEYGFSGNSSIIVAVTEETEDRIIGREYGHLLPEPGDQVVFIKENVAGWQDRPCDFEILQMSDEEYEQEMGFSKEEFYG